MNPHDADSGAGTARTLPVPARLLNASEVVELLRGEVSEDWVRRNVPGKVRLGHRTVLWRARDVLTWLEKL